MSDLLKGLAPWPKGDFSVFGEVEVRDMPRIQRFVGANMGRNWIAIPHVTHHDDADITDLEESRRARNAASGTRLTIVPLLVKILGDALNEFPMFNVSLDPEQGKIIQKKFVHVGVAVDTPKGLLVPVIRDCNSKSADAIAEEIGAASAKARDKGLSMDDMSGGCITLSSLGHIGGTSFTPIVNAPEVAILGVTRSRPVAVPAPDGGVTWRTMLPLSLSYDHRAINGADAARFVAYIARRLGDPASLMG